MTQDQLQDKLNVDEKNVGKLMDQIARVKNISKHLVQGSSFSLPCSTQARINVSIVYQPKVPLFQRNRSSQRQTKHQRPVEVHPQKVALPQPLAR